MRLQLLHALFHGGHVVFRKHVEPRAGGAQAIGSQLDLPGGFFAGNVQNRTAVFGDIGAHLGQQRGLADARVAAHQHHGAFHHAAPQHPIQFADAGGEPGHGLVGNIVHQHRLRAAAGGPL